MSSTMGRTKTCFFCSPVMSTVLCIVLFVFLQTPHSLAQNTTPIRLTETTNSVTQATSEGTDSPVVRQADDTTAGTDAASLTTIELGGQTVKICTNRHLCRNLGCDFKTTYYFTGSGEQPVAGPLCQCDPDCILFNDCCLDYEDVCVAIGGARGTADGQTTLVPEGLVYNDFICHFEETLRDGYYVIRKCPPDSRGLDSETRRLCEHVNLDDFLARIPVLGSKNTFPYVNVYCAICWKEDISNLQPWTMTFLCATDFLYDKAMRLLLDSTSSETLAFIQDNLGCSLIAKSSVNETVAAFRPCLLAANLCPSGHPMTDACGSYTALSEASLPFSGMVLFQNPHCFLCMEENIVHYTDCLGYYPFIDTGDGLSQPGSAPLLSVPPISIVFDFRSGGNVKVVSQEQIVKQVPVSCPELYVYDPFTSTCRQLSCAEGHRLKDSECTAIKMPKQELEGTIVYIHVTVCTRKPKSALEEVIKMCVAELGNFNQSQIQPSKMIPTSLATKNCSSQEGHHVLAVMVNIDSQTFQALYRMLQAIENHTLCSGNVEEIPIASMEMIYHDASLSLSRCNGRWVDGSAPHNLSHPAVAPGVSNATPVIRREILQYQEPPGDLTWSYQFQMCENPDLSCLLETFNKTSFMPDANDDNVLIYIPTGTAFGRDQYTETSEGQIQVCSFNDQNGTRNQTEIFTFFQYSPAQQILSLVGNVASMVAAVTTLVTFGLFKELRNRITCPVANYISALFVTQLTLLLSGSATSQRILCTIIAISGHYFLLVCVMWTTVFAFGLRRTFAARSTIQRSRRSWISPSSALFVWGIPSLIVVPCLIVYLCECTDLPLWYGNTNLCWIGNGVVSIFVVGLPIGMVVCTNVVLFTLTVHGIRRTKRETRSVQSNKSEMKLITEELIIYIKISTLMGFTWIFGFVAAITDVIALWYVFILLNSCQGLLVFVSFMCNKKVWRCWKRRICKECASRSWGTSRDTAGDRSTAVFELPKTSRTENKSAAEI